MNKQQLALTAHKRLHAKYPDAGPALRSRNAFEFLIAVMLSAQTTDEQVNKATPALFSAYPDAQALAGADQEDVEELVHSLGFFRQKAKSIIKISQALVETYTGKIPKTLDELVKLPGVGRKTANVVLAQAFGLDSGIAVDTHVGRIARRLGLTVKTNADKVADDLEALYPQDLWHEINLIWVLHGRQICEARKPKCGECVLGDICERVGI